MDQGDRVGAEECVGASGDLEMVGDVVAGFGGVHAGDGVAHGDSLVQHGEYSEAEALSQGGNAADLPEFGAASSGPCSVRSQVRDVRAIGLGEHGSRRSR